ncbi:DMT family transporter [Leptolyngbya sp. FACHB-671]|uniref:DMT family transporter n=1 Tax=Leptolyngbya sp. FACHB-671 TaxID=2692812 RepID=UPI0016882109|nr:DMT family transporter [Leptolyngbya sp. FACHB-671]MBD2067177.1 DMT family transporter [Leptolyngbya sp. FACHB-671]
MTAAKTLHNKGILLLLMTTLVWGTSFPLLKQMMGSISPSAILAVRFGVAAIAFLPWLRRLNMSLIRDGVLLGFVYFAECTFALIGLETISANRSAFVVSLNVIFVPILASLLGQRLPGRILVAAGVAIAGIGILSWEGGGLNRGDFLTFGCAIGIAIYILLLEWITPRHPTQPLVAVQLSVMALLSGAWALPQLTTQVGEIANHFYVLLYLGLVVTATPIWTQTLAQRWISAHEAALLYTFEPVFAAIFSFWLLGEALGVRGFLGAGFILFATFLSQSQHKLR